MFLVYIQNLYILGIAIHPNNLHAIEITQKTDTFISLDSFLVRISTQNYTDVSKLSDISIFYRNDHVYYTYYSTVSLKLSYSLCFTYVKHLNKESSIQTTLRLHNVVLSEHNYQVTSSENSTHYCVPLEFHNIKDFGNILIKDNKNSCFWNTILLKNNSQFKMNLDRNTDYYYYYYLIDNNIHSDQSITFHFSRFDILYLFVNSISIYEIDSSEKISSQLQTTYITITCPLSLLLKDLSTYSLDIRIIMNKSTHSISPFLIQFHDYKDMASLMYITHFSCSSFLYLESLPSYIIYPSLNDLISTSITCSTSINTFLFIDSIYILYPNISSSMYYTAIYISSIIDSYKHLYSYSYPITTKSYLLNSSSIHSFSSIYFNIQIYPIYSTISIQSYSSIHQIYNPYYSYLSSYNLSSISLFSMNKIFSKTNNTIQSIHKTISSWNTVPKDRNTELSYPQSEIMTYIYSDISISPTNQLYNKFSTRPSLPSSLSIDTIEGTITGSLDFNNTIQITIYAYNKYTQSPSSFVITFKPTSCPIGRCVLLYMHKSSTSTNNYEKVTVTANDNTKLTVFEGGKEGTIEFRRRCICNQDYYITLETTSTEGWEDQSYLELSINPMNINHTISLGRYTLFSETSKIYTLSSILNTLSITTLYYYYTDIIPNNWYNDTTSEMEWNKQETTINDDFSIKTKNRYVFLKISLPLYSLTNQIMSWFFMYRSPYIPDNNIGIRLYINEKLFTNYNFGDSNEEKCFLSSFCSFESNEYSLDNKDNNIDNKDYNNKDYYENNNDNNNDNNKNFNNKDDNNTFNNNKDNTYNNNEITSINTIWRSTNGVISSIYNKNGFFNITMGIDLKISQELLFPFNGVFYIYKDPSLSITHLFDFESMSTSPSSSIIHALDMYPGHFWYTTPSTWNSMATIYIHTKNNEVNHVNKICFISSRLFPEYDPYNIIIKRSLYTYSYPILSYTQIRWKGRHTRKCLYIEDNNSYITNITIELFEHIDQMDNMQYMLTEIELYSIDINNLIMPSLSITPQYIEGYVNIPIPYQYSSSEYYTHFSISSPSFPSLLIDSTSGTIYGQFNTTLEKTSLYYDIQTVQGQIIQYTGSIEINICNNTKGIISFLFPAYLKPYDVIITLKNTYNGITRIQSLTVYRKDQYLYLCEYIDIYSITISTSIFYPWYNTPFYIYTQKNNLIYQGILSSQLFHITLYHTIGDIFSPKTSLWRYLNIDTPANNQWYTKEYDNTLWPKAITISLPPPFGITQYYKTQFYIYTLSLYSILQITIHTYGGFVFYFNNHEFIRYNLPEGTITYETPSIEENIESYDFTFHIPLFYVNSSINANIIGIEIHKKTQLPSILDFDIHGLLIEQKPNLINDGILSSNVNILDTYSLIFLIDHNVNTYFYTNSLCTDAYFDYIYNNNKRVYVNSYSIQSTSSCNQLHPSSWIFQGSNNHGESWTLLHFAYNEYFIHYNQTKTFFFTNNIGYNIYRITIKNCTNTPLAPVSNVTCPSYGFQLQGIQFSVKEAEYSCTAISPYNNAFENTYSYQSCPIYYKGIKRRLCRNKQFEGEENLCESQVDLSFNYLNYTPTLYVNISVYLKSTLNYPSDSITSIPSLPASLSFDNYGNIYGIPLSSMNPTTYSITAIINNIHITSSLTFQILIGQCLQEDQWPLTVAGTNFTILCPDPINYEGFITRYCSSIPPFLWSDIYNNCTLKKPYISYPESVVILYRDDYITPIVPDLTTGDFYHISIIPELPEGLKFYEKTGIVDGMPTVEKTTEHTVTIINSQGKFSTTIKLMIVRLECSKEDGWSVTTQYQYAYKLCPLGYDGVQTRFCRHVSYGKCEWGDINMKNCFIYDNNEKPGSNKLFVYISFIMEGIHSISFSDPYSYEQFRQFFENYMVSTSISTYSIRIITIRQTSITSVSIVICIHIKSSSYDTFKNIIYKFINDSYDNPNTLIYICQKSNISAFTSVSSISFEGDGFQKVTNGFELDAFTIVIICTACAILLCLISIGICCALPKIKLYYRLKSIKSEYKRRLPNEPRVLPM
ncbi:hypothetical protein WA158_003141 [Blastocystis sp. Blastoise]